jgi:hypothetical protein
MGDIMKAIKIKHRGTALGSETTTDYSVENIMILEGLQSVTRYECGEDFCLQFKYKAQTDGESYRFWYKNAETRNRYWNETWNAMNLPPENPFEPYAPGGRS